MFFNKRNKKDKQKDSSAKVNIDKISDNAIEIQDEQGQSVYFEPKGTFRFEKRKKDYLIFEEVKTENKPKMIITSYTYVNGEFDLNMIEEKEELEEVSKEANSLLDQLKSSR